ncbi:MAG: hypothetical protein RL235_67, partial [Chlamydiota bacterium]
LLESFLKLYLIEKKRVVIPTGNFPESVSAVHSLGGVVDGILLEANTQAIDLDAMLQACCPTTTACVHLCNPNNPTGLWINLEQLLEFTTQVAPIPVCVSEANADFIGQTLISSSMPSNLVVVRSFSKAHGLAGLRVGYAVAAPEVIRRFKENTRNFRVSTLSQVAALAALDDVEHLRESVSYMLREKQRLMESMADFGFGVVASEGHTFIAKVPPCWGSADSLCSKLAQEKVAVVNCSIYPGLSEYIRIAPQSVETNDQFIAVMKGLVS